MSCKRFVLREILFDDMIRPNEDDYYKGKIVKLFKTWEDLEKYCTLHEIKLGYYYEKDYDTEYVCGYDVEELDMEEFICKRYHDYPLSLSKIYFSNPDS